MKRSAQFYYDINYTAALSAVVESIRAGVIHLERRPGSFGGVIHDLGDGLNTPLASLQTMAAGFQLPPPLRMLVIDRVHDRLRGLYLHLRTIHPVPGEYHDFIDTIELQSQAFTPMMTFLSADWDYLLEITELIVRRGTKFGRLGLVAPWRMNTAKLLDVVAGFVKRFSLACLMLDERDAHDSLGELEIRDSTISRCNNVLAPIPPIDGERVRLLVRAGRVSVDHVRELARRVDGIVLGHSQQMLPDELNLLTNVLSQSRK